MSSIALQRAWLHGPTARFIRHLVEMVIAMMVGMIALGVPLNAILVAQGYPDGLKAYPEISALAMTLEMTLAMAVWMLFRRHRFAIVAEMSAAMVAAAVIVVGLCVVHTLPAASAPGLADVGMYAAMLGLMVYRRSEYIVDHSAMQHSGAMHHAADPGPVPMPLDHGHADAAVPSGDIQQPSARTID
jgi:hypothetical protein